MPLKSLSIDHTAVNDLSPLQGMELESIQFSPKSKMIGLEVLREMTSINQIGTGVGPSLPAEEFWRKYDAGEFKK